MATFTDVLLTTFKVVGATELIGTFNTITRATSTLAEAASELLNIPFGYLVTPILITLTAVIAYLAAVTAAFTLATKSLHAFAEESKSLFHVGVILKNLGSSLTLPEVRRFADQISQQTGVQRPELEEAAAQIARTGISGGNIERTLKSIADAARATGQPIGTVAEAVEKGILGADRGLKAFGITLQDTGSRAANLELILQQLNLRFQGGAEAYRQTLPGSIDAMQASLQRFLSALGEQFAPAAIRIFNFLADALDYLRDNAAAVADILANLVAGPLGVLFVHGARAMDAGKNPLAKVGAGGDPATEKTLQQVADNTKMMADTVFQQVLGGGGQIVQQSFGFMAARMAMTI